MLSGEAVVKILGISDALVLIHLFTHHACLFPFFSTRTTAMTKPIKVYAEPKVLYRKWIMCVSRLAGVKYVYINFCNNLN
jgi:hypothetical protein